MRMFEETLQNNKIYNGRVTDYSKVSYKIGGEEIIFSTEQLMRDLKSAGYDDIHVSMLLEAIHHHDGAIHSIIAPNSDGDHV